ncbi:hypothetical protein NC652_041124 [Populus alba x Populus x berolinensis]|nr:hypothetical protein NC652_041124 [Populus alba x Populus x berolinensis]
MRTERLGGCPKKGIHSSEGMEAATSTAVDTPSSSDAPTAANAAQRTRQLRGFS